MKKSQVTLFMILGIMMLAIVVLFIAMAMPNSFTPRTTATSAKEFADSCFLQAHTCALYQLGNTAGNMKVSDLIAKLDNAKELGEDYLEESSVVCQDDFSAVKGSDVKADKPYADMQFNMRDTTTKVNQKMIITSGNSQRTVKDFVSKIPVRYESVDNLAKDIKNHDLTLIDNSYINAHLLEDDNIDANVYELEGNLIVLTDKLSRIEDNNYKFTFIK